VLKSDLVRSAGYVSTKKDGSERLNFTAFYAALLEAKGVSFGDGGGSGVGKAGRKLSFTTRVQFIGNTTSSANVSVGLHTQPFISREWDGCIGRPKGKEPQSCCIPFRCWPPPV